MPISVLRYVVDKGQNFIQEFNIHLPLTSLDIPNKSQKRELNNLLYYRMDVPTLSTF